MHNFFTAEIDQGAIATFCEDRVNLKRDRAAVYREQVNNLRGHLDRYIGEHPDAGLVKMLLSGSLAKGTALKTLNDVDVALYVRGDMAPSDHAALLTWLVERLRKTYHQMDPQNIYIDDPCIVISFSGTGLDVEVVPVFYQGDPQDRGYIWDRRTRAKILTSIPLHIAFFQKRKDTQPTHFAQVVRLIKWWAKQRAIDTDGFQIRNFALELIACKLRDRRTDFAYYHAALEAFFVYVQHSGLKERIAFNDNYDLSRLPQASKGVEIFDPVNPENNVTFDMTEQQRQIFVSSAAVTLDALAYAKSATTKGDALECWKELMGSSFDA